MRIRNHLSYANVAATLALLIALFVAPAMAGRTGGGPLSGLKWVTKYVTATPDTPDFNSSTFAAVKCPKGKKVIGGGFFVGSISPSVIVIKSGPNDTHTGWDLVIHNESGGDVDVTAYAACAKT